MLDGWVGGKGVEDSLELQSPEQKPLVGSTPKTAHTRSPTVTKGADLR